jgi:hypothetical protein
VIKGTQSIMNWVQKLLNSVAPVGKFVINSSEFQEDVITFLWQLQHANTKVLLYGKDSLVCQGNKISQHLTYISENKLDD